MSVKNNNKLIAAAVIALVIFIILVKGIMILADSGSVKVKNGSLGIIVTEGDSASSVAEFLHDEKVVKYPLIFKLKARIKGYDKQIKPGTVEITSGMSYDEILAGLTQDNRDSFKLVIPEGYELKQIREVLADNGIVSEEEFDSALNPADYDYRFLGSIPDRENALEGYLFPSTYEVAEGMSAHEIIDMLLREFDRQFSEEYYQRAADVNCTVDEIITMASIIERETDSQTERAKVAGVFYNRLNQGMKLQSCATVQYFLGERKAVLSVADTQKESPYNTYINEGLPIGPICNPGMECIKAALYPEKTDALFFVMGKDGNHVFSTTYEEHLEAMQGMDPQYSVEGN